MTGRSSPIAICQGMAVPLILAFQVFSLVVRRCTQGLCSKRVAETNCARLSMTSLAIAEEQQKQSSNFLTVTTTTAISPTLEK